MIIRFTKEGDRLPLSTFEVSSGKSCMDSDSQVSINFFPVELQRASECPLEKTTNMKNDPRYSDVFDERVTLQYKEWDLMMENGVADLLLSLPFYSRAIGA